MKKKQQPKPPLVQSPEEYYESILPLARCEELLLPRGQVPKERIPAIRKCLVDMTGEMFSVVVQVNRERKKQGLPPLQAEMDRK